MTELAQALFGASRMEEGSSQSTEHIKAHAISDSVDGHVSVTFGDVIGDTTDITIPTTDNVRAGDEVIVSITGGVGKNPIIIGSVGSGDRISGEVARAQAEADKAALAAAEAQKDAQTAKSAAESATADAATAKAQAENATADAATAKAQAANATADAQAARTQAEAAKSAADVAQSVADAAKTSAATAKGAADSATQDARAAGMAAATAQAAAEAAQADIDESKKYFYHDKLGAHVLASDGSNKRADITSAGFSVVDVSTGSEVVSAKDSGFKFSSNTDIDFDANAEKIGVSAHGKNIFSVSYGDGKPVLTMTEVSAFDGYLNFYAFEIGGSYTQWNYELHRIGNNIYSLKNPRTKRNGSSDFETQNTSIFSKSATLSVRHGSSPVPSNEGIDYSNSDVVVINDGSFIYFGSVTPTDTGNNHIECFMTNWGEYEVSPYHFLPNGMDGSSDRPIEFILSQDKPITNAENLEEVAAHSISVKGGGFYTNSSFDFDNEVTFSREVTFEDDITLVGKGGVLESTPRIKGSAAFDGYLSAQGISAYSARIGNSNKTATTTTDKLEVNDTADIAGNATIKGSLTAGSVTAGSITTTGAVNAGTVTTGDLTVNNAESSNFFGKVKEWVQSFVATKSVKNNASGGSSIYSKPNYAQNTGIALYAIAEDKSETCLMVNTDGSVTTHYKEPNGDLVAKRVIGRPNYTSKGDVVRIDNLTGNKKYKGRITLPEKGFWIVKWKGFISVSGAIMVGANENAWGSSTHVTQAGLIPVSMDIGIVNGNTCGYRIDCYPQNATTKYVVWLQYEAFRIC